jgi:hypothetical protein
MFFKSTPAQKALLFDSHIDALSELEPEIIDGFK